MAAQILVFLGPSLPVAQAQQILDAIYLPPAAQSDLISAVEIYQPDVIGLVDGVFLSRPSVWHKEILYALGQGISVYGASSMGALRAAEMSAFGMIGVGQIYQMYAAGKLLDDDEVALAHGSSESKYQSLSEPMVNVRATFQLAKDQGILSESLLKDLITIAKSIYFSERTFTAIFHQARQAEIDFGTIVALETFVQESYVNLKQQDAILLLKTLSQKLGSISIEHNPVKPLVHSNFDLAQTHVYAALYECDRQVQRQGVQIPLRQISEHVALYAADFDDLNFQSLNRMLVQVFASFLKVNVEVIEIEQEKQRFCFKHQLRQDSDLNQWLQVNDMTELEFQFLMQEVAICRRLHRWFLTRQAYQRNVKGLLNELRLQNQYSEWADAAAQEECCLQSHSVELNDSQVDPADMNKLLLEHLQAINRRIPTSLQEWILEAGFLDFAGLQVALLKAKTIRDMKLKKSRMESR